LRSSSHVTAKHGQRLDLLEDDVVLPKDGMRSHEHMLRGNGAANYLGGVDGAGKLRSFFDYPL
jgi:hypothetical protein